MMEAFFNTVIHTIIYLTCGSLFVRSVVSLIKREIRAYKARKAYKSMINEFNEFNETIRKSNLNHYFFILIFAFVN